MRVLFSITSICLTVVFSASVAYSQQPLLTFDYELEEPGQVSAAVYDLEGRPVRTLLSGARQEAGNHTLEWDGLDRYGVPQPTGEYEIRILRTPGFTAEFVTTVGTNPPVQAYEVGGKRAGGRGWVGNHAGPMSLAIDESGLYVGSSIAEFSPVLLNQTLDGTRHHWQSLQYQVNMGPIAMGAGNDNRLYFLQENARIVVVDAETGQQIAMWDILPEGLDRDPNQNYGNGEKVYPRSRTNASLAIFGEVLVVTCPRTEILRWLSTEDGSVIATIDMPEPAGAEVSPAGAVYAISNKVVFRVEQDGTKEQIIIEEDLRNPSRLSYDTVNNHLLIADSGTHQVKRFNLNGALLAAYGREGGREPGAYVPSNFMEIADITTDGQGGFVVVEPWVGPRRTAHFNSDGELIQEWYGGTQFFTPASIDPENPRLVWFPTGEGWIVQAEVDYDNGSYRVLEVHNPGRHLPAGPLGAGAGSNWNTPWQVRYHDDKRYLISQTSPPVVLMHDPEHHTLEAVVIGSDDEDRIERAKELAGNPDVEASSFIWTDLNGDREVQPDEIRFFTDSMRGDPGWKGVGIGRDFDVLTSGTVTDPQTGETTRLIRRLAQVGWHGNAPLYADEIETIGEAVEHEALGTGAGYFQADDGSIFMNVHYRGDRHGYGWPTTYSGAIRIFKWNPDGSHGWTIGRATHLAPRDRRTPAGHLHHSVGFAGEAQDCIIVTDRSGFPATAWTQEDGLYAGYFFDNRADDGLPDNLYCWWRTADGVDSIINYDCEAVGAVVTLDDGSVYWYATGWQTIVVYRITGWDGWTRINGRVSLNAVPQHAKAQGQGLKAEYFNNVDFEGEPAITRVDGQLWFAHRRWYGFPARTGGQVWADRGPAPDVISPSAFSARWTGTIEAPLTEPFVISAYITPGGKDEVEVRVWLNDEQILDSEQLVASRFHGVSGKRADSKPIPLQAGQPYSIRVEFVSRGDKPTLSLNWCSPSMDRVRIPKAHLYPAEE